MPTLDSMLEYQSEHRFRGYSGQVGMPTLDHSEHQSESPLKESRWDLHVVLPQVHGRP